jgi:1-acyl-sn-glycerol-3-phosphate acyltransferase
MLRRFVITVIGLIFKLFSRMEVLGLENVPKHGAALIVINHMSLIDAPLVAIVVDRPDMTALIGDSYQNILPMRWLVNAAQGIWINRSQADFHALRQALDFLSSGGLLGIAPEGTRSKVGSMIPAKTGVAYLADKAKVPLIPTAISGSEIAFRELRRFHRPRLQLQFGQPFHLPSLERKDREAGMQRNTDEIMCRIAAMLPSTYWGVYCDHPRLAELTGEEDHSKHHEISTDHLSHGS